MRILVQKNLSHQKSDSPSSYKIFYWLCFIVCGVFITAWLVRLAGYSSPLVYKEIIYSRENADWIRQHGHDVEGDWIFENNALLLPAGGKGAIFFRNGIAADDNDCVNKFIVFYQIHTAKIKSPDTQVIVQTGVGKPKHLKLNGKTLTLRDKVANKQTRLSITAQVGAGAAPVTILRRIERTVYTKKAQNNIITVLFFSIALCIAALIFYSKRIGNELIFIYIIIIICSVSGLFANLLPWLTNIIFVIIILAMGIILSRRSLAGAPPQKFLILLCMIIAMGYNMRWINLVENVGQHLDPDAVGYFDIAQKGGGLFQTATTLAPYIREPLFIWLIKIIFLFLSKTQTALRILTFLLSLAVIPAVYIVVKRITDARAGLGAAFACAANPYFIFMSARGLRMELFILCTLGLLYALILMQEWAKWGWLWTGLAAGALCLTQVTSLSYVIPLIIYFGCRRSVRPLALAAALVMPLFMIASHLHFNYKQFGDPLYSTNIHARFYRNREFVGRPGFPTVQEVKADPYTGEPITSYGYIIKLHTIPQIIKISSRGLYRIFIRGHAANGLLAGSRLLLILYFIGIAIIAVSEKRKWLGIAIVIEAPAIFIAGIELDWRLTMHVAPIVYLLLMTGLFNIINISKEGIRYACRHFCVRSRLEHGGDP